MSTARVFANGGSQAVRLPKDFRFESGEVGIQRVGDVVVLYPLDKGWDVMEQGAAMFTDDFLVDRDQPPAAESRPSL